MNRTFTSGAVLLTATAGATAGTAAALRRKVAASPRKPVGDLTGKTAVVTGAASGIGRSLALLLARHGALVHAADISQTGVAAVVKEIDAALGKAVAHVVDVSDAHAVCLLADAAFDGGAVDLLFNNAGIGQAGELADTTLADWRRLIDVNLLGVVNGLHAFLPRLLEQDRPAHVVNTASMAGLVPAAGLGAYSATKAAVVALTEVLDIELRGTQIRVSALCPGVINTPIVATSVMRGDWEERRGRLIELYATRGCPPDVVARQALAATGRGRLIIPAPRYQVVPHWLLKRMIPAAGRAVSVASYRYLAKGR